MIQLSSRQRHYLTIFLFLSPFLLGTGIDLYVPSLPAIAHYFNASKQAVQLTIPVYLLGYALSQAFVGVLSDSLGRKKLAILGGFFFTLASVLAIFAPNIHFLMLCRFLQGVGIAAPNVTTRAMIIDCFEGVELARMMSYLSMSWALGPIIGPVIGGYLQHFLNWRANFYFFAIYGFIAYGFAQLTLPETKLELLPLQPKKIYINFKEIITNAVFIKLTAMATLIYATMVVFNAIAPFLIQVGLGYTPIEYGHIALAMGTVYFLGNLLNRVLISYLSIKTIIFWGNFFALLMTLLILLLGVLFSPNLYILFFPALGFFFFSGLVFPSIITGTATLFPHIAGMMSSIYGSAVCFGVFFISGLSTLLKTNTQVPLGIMYSIMLVFCLLLSSGLQKRRS